MALHRINPLTEINGLGPASEQRLRQAGVQTFAQLAELTPEEIAGMLTAVKNITAARIAHEDWVGQARALAQSHNSQQYATFKVQYLLNADKTVRRTTVTHVQTQANDAWAGWQPPALLDFMTEQAHLSLPATLAEVPPPQLAAAPSPGLHGRLALKTIALVPDKSGGSRTVRDGQRPFAITTAIDASDLQVSGHTPPQYELTVMAKCLEDGRRQVLGQHVFSGEADLVRQLNIPPRRLAPNLYRLEAKARATIQDNEVVIESEGELLRII